MDAAARNAPCPCGSGRKYKKCCLGAAPAARPGELDCAALVDRAIASGDWTATHAVFDDGFALFHKGEPLAHVRFRHDELVMKRPGVAPVWAKLCNEAWQRRCQHEIDHVLAGDELEPRERDGLRLAGYLLRRFGARSPLVEELAKLQTSEHSALAQGVLELLARHGLEVADLGTSDNAETVNWIERDHPRLVLFSDWMVLRVVPNAEALELWLSGIAGRVCQMMLMHLERSQLPEPRDWLRAAAIAILVPTAQLGFVLARKAPPPPRDDDERVLLEALMKGNPTADSVAALTRAIATFEGRGDYTGAAMLRAAAPHLRRMVQA